MATAGHERSERFHAAVQAEIDEERAAVLGRVAERLERARARCTELAAALDASAEPDAQTVAAYRAAHDESEHWRWVLCLQREAIGLYDHRWVDAVYPSLPRR
jgi:hypothetical protein